MARVPHGYSVRTWARGVGWLLLPMCAGLVVCSGAPGGDEVVACTVSAVMGSAKIDTQFPAVGLVAGCTATLIGPDAVLLAAHCVAEYARGCRTKEETLRSLRFSLSPPGCLENVHRADVDCEAERVTYALADVVVHPRAYEHSACVDPHCSQAGVALVGPGLVPVFDVAVARLVRRVNPTRGAAALSVITSITDDDAAPFTVHRRLNAKRFQAPIGCERPQAIVVGWGSNDLAAHVRVAGLADFFDGPSWDQVCQHVSECGESSPTSLCAPDGGRGVFQAQALRTHRGSSAPGAFDREVTWLGDSGGPLLVRGGQLVGAVPELNDGFYVVGVLSGGELPGLPIHPGQDIEDVHPATFEPSNARFIEETLLAFSNAVADPVTLEPAPDDAGAGIARDSHPSR